MDLEVEQLSCECVNSTELLVLSWGFCDYRLEFAALELLSEEFFFSSLPQ